MNNPIIIAVDAMGGDNSPDKVIEGISIHSKSSMDVKYKIFGNISFYERTEIKDMICYLRFISNPNDSIAFNRIINTPSRGIGAKTLQKMIDIKTEDMTYIELLKLSLDSNDFNTFLSDGRSIDFR